MQLTGLLIPLRRQQHALITQAYLGDISGSVPDHQNQAIVTIKQVTQIF